MTFKHKDFDHDHYSSWNEMGYCVYNPEGYPLESLPSIYGFNNGGPSGLLNGCLLAEDGTALGAHACSNEVFMVSDLGILLGSRPDRHQSFRGHYPDGYKMDFVSYGEVLSHGGLTAAMKLHVEVNEEKETTARSSTG